MVALARARAGARGRVPDARAGPAIRPRTTASSRPPAASAGRLVAFCRVDPHAHALREARRCLDAGARGIKLHPRAEQFTLSEPVVRDLIALAHERRVPVLIHAGRGIPALGRDTVRLSGEFPDAQLILAHAAISDLAWLWRVLPDHPNLFIDTAWWDPADMMALFTLAPPANVLWASDSPYGLPLTSAVLHLRLAAQAGLDARALRSIAGGQIERLLNGAEPRRRRARRRSSRGRSTRCSNASSRTPPRRSRARSAKAIPRSRWRSPGSPARSATTARTRTCSRRSLELLDLYEEHLAPPPPGRRFPARGAAAGGGVHDRAHARRAALP